MKAAQKRERKKNWRKNQNNGDDLKIKIATFQIVPVVSGSNPAADWRDTQYDKATPQKLKCLLTFFMWFT